MGENIELVKKTISWINDTFVPLGLRPVESLDDYRACPQQGERCVIALVLQSNPQWDNNVTVGVSRIQIGYKNSWDELLEFDVPTDVGNFIRDFDNGEYPSLVDLESFDEHFDTAPHYRRTILEKMQAAGIDVKARIDDTYC